MQTWAYSKKCKFIFETLPAHVIIRVLLLWKALDTMLLTYITMITHPSSCACTRAIYSSAGCAVRTLTCLSAAKAKTTRRACCKEQRDQRQMFKKRRGDRASPTFTSGILTRRSLLHGGCESKTVMKILKQLIYSPTHAVASFGSIAKPG